MAERIKELFCIDCIHLQRNDPYISGQMALYRCSCQSRDGKVVGWVQKDKPQSGLRKQGGSCCNRLYPGDMFDIRSRFSDKYKRYMYCGKRGKVRILISIPDRVYTPVPNDYFRTQCGGLRSDIKIVMQTDEQKGFHRGLAKNIMRKN